MILDSRQQKQSKTMKTKSDSACLMCERVRYNLPLSGSSTFVCRENIQQLLLSSTSFLTWEWEELDRGVEGWFPSFVHLYADVQYEQYIIHQHSHTSSFVIVRTYFHNTFYVLQWYTDNCVCRKAVLKVLLFIALSIFLFILHAYQWNLEAAGKI